MEPDQGLSVTRTPSSELPVAVVVHLSGSRRGTTERLNGELLRIGTDPEVEIHLPAGKEPAVSARHAVLYRSDGNEWSIRAEPGESVEVNGARVGEIVLESGDILQIGEYGPLLRFRIYRGQDDYKSMLEAFADCVDCARYGGDGAFERTMILMGGIPRELSTETSPLTRALLVILLASLIAMIGLTWHSSTLQRQLASEQLRVQGLSEMLARAEASSMKRADIEELRQSIESDLEGTQSRVEALEAGAEAPQRLLALYSRSVVFLQGSWAFFDRETGRPLRLVGLAPDGVPIMNSDGEPLVTLEGAGPVIENFFTGTGFFATADGLIVTNRHVAIPWEIDPSTQFIESQGLMPRMHRFIGFIAGEPAAFSVKLLEASDDADLAVLRCSGVEHNLEPIPITEEPAIPGDEILVMGFPTGIRALVARADDSFVRSLVADETIDFWTIATRLSEAGHIAPLATRGIVGQVTSARVVYDAETTSGGSGGPAINLAGEVVAINSAVLPEFGGSNLGVPAGRARELLGTVDPSWDTRETEPVPVESGDSALMP